jgi:hypothetical protein
MMSFRQHRPLFNLSVALLALLAFPSGSQAVTRIVPTQYPTIQGALNAALSGDTVLVQPGTYSGVSLQFNGRAIHLKSANGPTVTKIQGNLASPVFNITQGETRTTIIEGFTITGGSRVNGGGMILNGTSPTIRGNIFTGNRATGVGGGGGGGAIQAVNTPANPLIINNTFTNNEAKLDGGAIHTDFNAIADIRENTFVTNRALQGSGAGIRVSRSTTPFTIAGNRFDRNTAVFAGGAISAIAVNVTIQDNVITNNNGGVYAGGIHIETQDMFGNRTTVIKNNRLEGNRASRHGGAIHTWTQNTTSPITISRNVIIGNTSVNPACASGICGSGGAMSNSDGKGLMLVRDNVIRDNIADRYGAAVFAKTTSSMPLTFTDNQVINNQAHRLEPGVATVNTFATQITRNIFRGNHFTATGGDRAYPSSGALRLVNFLQGALVEGNSFIANRGMLAGAVVAISGDTSTLRIAGNTVVDNRLQPPIDPSGSAFLLRANSTICNNTFTNNDLVGLRINRPASPPLAIGVSFNHFTGNSTGLLADPPALYTTVSALNAAALADNNIDGNPLFVSDGSYRLSNTSPLINKANAACFQLATDIQGESRPSPADIGSDEFSLRDPDTVGLFQPTVGTFHLRNSNTTGGDHATFQYGPSPSSWVPLAGDWDGNGTTTVGLFDRATATFHLRNSNTAGADNVIFRFGTPGTTWVPLAGDWDGNLTTTIGLYNPATSQFFLRNSNSSGAVNVTFIFGLANYGWLPIVGDWNGDGRQTVGLFRPSTSTFYLRNANTSGGADLTFSFGSANVGSLPIAGDWNGDLIFGVGLYRPSTSTVSLRNALTPGAADRTFIFGTAGAGWKPLVGQWDGF